eukprot:CAMPEP_0118798142 /NCGR_PEP_ID=MMETSP1161-20130426/567_1 /TAXON_ID=249345 /ORGANISM="Picochlorum oklahomensis, Strain CCMP2329" /LENGTH=388 /DNA_ID=CAMNT_0006725463 /DNA_START=2179 /DNA_END=3345 /DNA_ORIENTATION=-
MDASYKLHPWWWFEEPAVGVGVPGYNWESGGVLWLVLRHFLGVEMEEVPEGLNGDGLFFDDNGICLGDRALCMVLQFVHVASAPMQMISVLDLLIMCALLLSVNWKKMVEAGARPSYDALRAVLDPFIEGLRASENKVLLKKIYSDVFAEIAQRVESNAEPFGSMWDVQSLAQELFSLGSHKKTKSKNREYLYLASSDVEQALKHAEKKTVVKKSKKKAAKKEDEIPVRIVQEAPEEEEAEEEDQVEKTIAEAPTSQENKKKKKKKKAKSNTGSEPASGSHENGINATPHHIDDEPSQKTRRKSVRFSLKKNLVRRIGQPPFPENVRTPPTSKPKGSALKQMPLANQNRKRMLTFSDAVDEPSSLETKTKKKKKDVKKTKKKMMMTES